MTHLMLHHTALAACTGKPPQHATEETCGEAVTKAWERVTCPECRRWMEVPQMELALVAL
jgi:hypothetical protein